MQYRIVADSSANLTKLDSTVSFRSVPLHVIVGDRDFTDIESTSTDALQTALKEYKGKTTTSCPNAEEWLEAFGEDADVIFCVTITSILSGAFSSANTAKHILESTHPEKTVYVIDSLTTGPEMVLIIEKIQDLILAGKAHKDIYDEVCAYMQHTHLFFSLASLNNFARNGRVNPILAKGIGVLGIRVTGRAAEGNLKPMGKSRGDKKSIAQLVEYMKECGYTNGKVLIAHTVNPEGAQELKESIHRAFGAFRGRIQENRVLCSYYAEPMSLLLGFET